jgi:hypothetical protein
MKTLRLTATTEDGEVLDMTVIEVPDDTKAIEYRPINTEMSGDGRLETLTLGTAWK